MVLEFPIMADYGLMVLEGKAFTPHTDMYTTRITFPPLQDGRYPGTWSHPYTEGQRPSEAGGGRHIAVLNPGSVSIPKGGNPSTYAMLEDGVFSIRTLEGEVVKGTEAVKERLIERRKRLKTFELIAPLPFWAGGST